MSHHALERANAAFWDVLCGWNLAQSAGITGRGEDDLRRFDELYLQMYPYLEGYVDRKQLAGKRVLEIGLGYGTLGQLVAERAREYHGVDIAAEPVAVMRRRLEWLDKDPALVRQASALELPYEPEMFDYVFSIGCLHHTGDLPRAVDEVYRVLKPGGRAVVMVYYRFALRRRSQAVRDWLHGRRGSEAELRARYDANSSGVGPPHTDFVSRAEARKLFRRFARLRMDVRNFDNLGGGRIYIPRERLLSTLGRVLGLDLYIVADKASGLGGRAS